MNTKQGITPILIAGIVAVLVLVAGGYFYVQKQQMEDRERDVVYENWDDNFFKRVNVAQEENDKTAGWKTYRNEEHGFEIQYPGEWSYEQEILTSGTKSTQFNNSKGEYILTINNPIREIGYEVFDTVEKSQVSIPETDKYFTKIVWTSSVEKGGLILIYWELGDFWTRSGEFALGYINDDDPNIKILDQILLTFKSLD